MTTVVDFKNTEMHDLPTYDVYVQPRATLTLVL